MNRETLMDVLFGDSSWENYILNVVHFTDNDHEVTLSADTDIAALERDIKAEAKRRGREVSIKHNPESGGITVNISHS